MLNFNDGKYEKTADCRKPQSLRRGRITDCIGNEDTKRGLEITYINYNKFTHEIARASAKNA
jgi:hypothetical protein